MHNKHLFSKLVIAEKNFKGTSYEKVVENARRKFDTGYENTATALLTTLPTVESLLKKLVEKLEKPDAKGRVRPVCRTLRLIAEKKLVEGDSFLKGLFSLGTHTLIEMEQGHKEYRMVLNFIYERIGEILYSQNS
jgi:hypothetical protein